MSLFLSSQCLKFSFRSNPSFFGAIEEDEKREGAGFEFTPKLFLIGFGLKQKLFCNEFGFKQKLFSVGFEFMQILFSILLKRMKNIFGWQKGLFRRGKTCVCGHFASGKIIFPKSLHFRFIRANILSRSPPVEKRTSERILSE